MTASRKETGGAATRAPQLPLATRAAGAKPGRGLNFPNVLPLPAASLRGFSSTGRRPFPHDDIRRPTPIDLRRGRSYAAAFGGPTIEGGGGFSFDVHPGLAPIFGCAALLNSVACSHEPGSQAARESADVCPIVGVFHAPNLGACDVREAEQAFRVQGEARRERG